MKQSGSFSSQHLFCILKKASQSQFVPNQQSRTQRGKLQFFSPDLKVGRLIHVVLLLQAGLLVIKKKIRAKEFVEISKTQFSWIQQKKKVLNILNRYELG